MLATDKENHENDSELDNEDLATEASSTITVKSKITRWTYREAGQELKHDYQEFKAEVERCLKRVGCNQSRLAEAMNSHPTVLNRKLSGVRALKTNQLKQVIKLMVEWGALTDIATIEALLKLRNLNLTIFTGEDWNNTPLCQLASAAFFATSAAGSASSKLGKSAAKPPSTPLPFSVMKPVAPPYNLPLLTKATFIGRKHELAYLAYMLCNAFGSSFLQNEAEPGSSPVRLLTLTGPGGIGKTTLAQQLGAELLTKFEHGIYFVDLSEVRKPEQLPGTIARTIGLNEVQGLAIEYTLKNHLKARNMLLILDNFEQILEAGLFVNELIEAAPGVRVIVTSRELLHLRNEQEYIVPLMSVPNLKSRKQAFMPNDPTDLTANELSGYEAVALFAQRAKEARPSFTLTNQNAKAVAEICVKLEGLPLAIELAASRVRTLSPQEILELLTPIVDLQDSQRSRPLRHQTLRAVIDWSYELLNAKEQDLLRILSVFASGFTFNAVVAVYGEKLGTTTLKKKQTATLTLLTSLIDKSLLRTVEVTGSAEPVPENPETRYAMLESIREYALELLEENQEEATQVRNWHANYYLKLAEEAEPNLRGGGKQAEWLTRLNNAYDNFNLALQWLVDTKNTEKANRLSGSLGLYWFVRGYFTETRTWLELVLSVSDSSGDTIGKAKVLYQFGRLEDVQGHSEKALELYNHAKQIYQEFNDLSGLAYTYLNLGNVYYRQYNNEQANTYYSEAVKLAKIVNEEGCLAKALNNLGNIAVQEQKYEEARSLLNQGTVIDAKLGNQMGVACNLIRLSHIEALLKNYEEAQSLCEQGIKLCRKLYSSNFLLEGLLRLSYIFLAKKEHLYASPNLKEALFLAKELKNYRLVEGYLGQLALAAVYNAGYSDAMRFWFLAEELGKTRSVFGDAETTTIHNEIYNECSQQLSPNEQHAISEEVKELLIRKELDDEAYGEQLLSLSLHAVG